MSGQAKSMASDLPGEIGLFPLEEALLLPGGRLPLHIFEPRYRNLVNDAMNAGHRLIGIIQPDGDPKKDGKLQKIGCVGRISSYTEISMDIYLIVLSGRCRFEVKKELSIRNGYRVAKVGWENYVRDDLENKRKAPVDRAEIKRHLKAYLENRGLDANWDIFSKVPDDELVTSLAMICPFSPKEKQDLLETKTKDNLTERLLSLLRIGAANLSVPPTLH